MGSRYPGAQQRVQDVIRGGLGPPLQHLRQEQELRGKDITGPVNRVRRTEHQVVGGGRAASGLQGERGQVGNTPDRLGGTLRAGARDQDQSGIVY